MTRKNLPDNSSPRSADKAGGRSAGAVRDILAENDAKRIALPRQHVRKSDETCPLRITQQQRESMIHAARIKNKLRERLKEAGDGTQIVGFTLRELEHLNDELGQAAVYGTGRDKTRLVAVLHKVTDLLSEELAGVVEDVAPKTRK